MARELSKKNLELVLTQAMMAAENVRTQRGRLLELHRRLLRHQHQAEIGQLATDVFNVYFHGLDAGAKMLAFCLGVAVQNRAVSTINIAFALMPDDQLHDALLAQRLPARPTTLAEALARVDSALLAVKTLGEHHLPRCVECLVGGRAPVRGKLDLSVADATATEGIDKVDPVAADATATEGIAKVDPVAAAATEGIAKVDLLSDDPVAAAATEGIAKVDLLSDDPAAAKTGRDVDKAVDYLCRANRMTTLAVKHIDLAVAVLSRFVDPKELARLADLIDGFAYLGVEEGFYLASD
ncbi:hypothetical protein ZWY2020_031145 [Hordeum vulgare]|nr:hypothetical protein ZWY2020_031145 [Hordeum vulgare]